MGFKHSILIIGTFVSLTPYISKYIKILFKDKRKLWYIKGAMVDIRATVL